MDINIKMQLNKNNKDRHVVYPSSHQGRMPQRRPAINEVIVPPAREYSMGLKHYPLESFLVLCAALWKIIS